MPELSRFFGIVITMYFDDHEPPHFHVQYGECRAAISIDPRQLMKGDLPPRVLGLVVEWAQIHLRALRDNWTSLRTEGKFAPIPPLD